MCDGDDLFNQNHCRVPIPRPSTWPRKQTLPERNPPDPLRHVVNDTQIDRSFSTSLHRAKLYWYKRSFFVVCDGPRINPCISWKHTWASSQHWAKHVVCQRYNQISLAISEKRKSMVPKETRHHREITMTRVGTMRTSSILRSAYLTASPCHRAPLLMIRMRGLGPDAIWTVRSFTWQRIRKPNSTNLDFFSKTIIVLTREITLNQMLLTKRHRCTMDYYVLKRTLSEGQSRRSAIPLPCNTTINASIAAQAALSGGFIPSALAKTTAVGTVSKSVIGYWYGWYQPPTWSVHCMEQSNINLANIPPYHPIWKTAGLYSRI